MLEPPRQQHESVEIHEDDGGTLSPASSPGSPTRRDRSAAALAERRQKRLEDFLDRQHDRKWEVRRELTKKQAQFLRDDKIQDEVMLQRGVDGFRTLLIRRYGTVAAAWRLLLDPSNFGKVCFSDFCERCNRIGFNGNLQEVWSELSKSEDHFILLEDLDKEADAAIAEFMFLLRHRFGSTLDAWKQFLNPKERLTCLPEDVFLERCEALGVSSDPKKLFQMLRTNLNRHDLTYQDIDPPAYAALSRADPCTRSLGDGTVPRLGSGPIPKPQLSQAALAHLYPPKASFAATGMTGGASQSRRNSRASRKSSRAHILAKNLAGAVDRSACVVGMPGHRAPTRSSAWTREVSVAQIAELEVAKSAHAGADLAVRNVDDFKEFLARRYGSLFAAWQFLLDPMAKGQIFFMEFSERVRGIGFAGDCRKLWTDLGALPNGGLQLKNLDEQAHRMLSEFRYRFCLQHGNMLKAWRNCLDPEDRGYVDREVFLRECTSLGFQGDAKQLFSMLQDKLSRGNGGQSHLLTLREFDLKAYKANLWSDIEMVSAGKDATGGAPAGLAPGTRPGTSSNNNNSSSNNNNTSGAVERTSSLTVSRYRSEGSEGNFSLMQSTMTASLTAELAFGASGRLALGPMASMASEKHGQLVGGGGGGGGEHQVVRTYSKRLQQEPVAKKDLGFAERQESIFSYRWKQTISLQTRAAQEQEAREKLAADKACNTWEGVVAFLKKKYGTLATAWRVALDPLRQQQLTKEEFSKALRLRVGYRGDVQELWTTLATSQPNYITLNDIDPAAATLLAGFWTFLLGRFGTLVLAWKALDKRREGRLEAPQFCERLRELGFEGDGQELFLLLRSAPHRTFVTLDDLDTRAEQAYYRQDHACTTVPGLPPSPTLSPKRWGARRASRAKEAAEHECDQAVQDEQQEEASGSGRSIDQQGIPGGDSGDRAVTASSNNDDNDNNDSSKSNSNSNNNDNNDNFKSSSSSGAVAGEEGGSNISPTTTGLSACRRTLPPALASAHPSSPPPPAGAAADPEDSAVRKSSPSPPRVAADTRTSEWQRELGCRQRQAAAEEGERRWQATRAIKTVQDFRKALVERYRSTVAAWRTIIDPELTNHVTFSQFFLALDRLGGLNSKLKRLWADFDRQDKGFITFEDFDPGAQQDLDEFREELVGKFSNLTFAWQHCLAAASDRSPLETFLKRCSFHFPSRWTKQRLERIYTLLMPTPVEGRHFLVQEDLEALLISTPAAERSAIRDVPPKPETGKSRVSAQTVMKSLKKCGGNYNEIPTMNLDDLHKLMKAQYGSIWSCWVHHLDVMERGRVPEAEFARRAKELGVLSNVHQLFRIVDKSGKGYITLQDLDSEVNNAVTSFFKDAEKRYGSLIQCWWQFDPGAKGCVNKEEFMAGCAAMNYAGDSAKLFDFFRPEKDRAMLYLEDLGPKGREEHRKNTSQATKVCRMGHPLHVWICSANRPSVCSRKDAEDSDDRQGSPPAQQRHRSRSRSRSRSPSPPPGMSCGNCRRNGIQYPELVYRCQECSFYLCGKCFASDKLKLKNLNIKSAHQSRLSTRQPSREGSKMGTGLLQSNFRSTLNSNSNSRSLPLLAPPTFWGSTAESYVSEVSDF